MLFLGNVWGEMHVLYFTPKSMVKNKFIEYENNFYFKNIEKKIIATSFS